MFILVLYIPGNTITGEHGPLLNSIKYYLLSNLDGFLPFVHIWLIFKFINKINILNILNYNIIYYNIYIIINLNFIFIYHYILRIIYILLIFLYYFYLFIDIIILLYIYIKLILNY